MGPGKLAHIVVLFANPLEVDPWEVRDIMPEEKIREGEIVYKNR